MTNYRIQICEEHDKPQFKYCFDCGSPLIPVSYPDGVCWTCSKNTYHVKFFPLPHSLATDPEFEGDCDLFKVLE